MDLDDDITDEYDDSAIIGTSAQKSADLEYEKVKEPSPKKETFSAF